ncbi:putative alpha/beta hydrolase family esterase [Kitasatospora sp. GP82]|nr:putative alpha/beta hydrolase family esterase [Kitasatospora sp. GP82]
MADRPGPIVLVAHSLGCVTVAHWAAARTRTVHAALLVAPADIETAEVPELVTFRPIPLRPLPFPSLLVSSSDDPWCSADRARRFADGWDSAFVDLGAYGHINSDSGLGAWPQGRELLTRLLTDAAPGPGAGPDAGPDAGSVAG